VERRPLNSTMPRHGKRLRRITSCIAASAFVGATVASVAAPASAATPKTVYWFYDGLFKPRSVCVRLGESEVGTVIGNVAIIGWRCDSTETANVFALYFEELVA